MRPQGWMFVSGLCAMAGTRAGKAGPEADGGEVGGGDGRVGLRGEAARRSGAASEVAVWACGVAAAARAAATAPGLRLFVLGALGGVAGVLEGRESGVCKRFSAEGECMRTSALLGAGGGGDAGAGAGGAGWAELGAAIVRSRMKAVHTAWHDFQRSTLAILQASSCRRISACARRSACFAARAALRRVRALVAARLPPCSEHDSRLDSLGEPPCFAARSRARGEAG